MAPESNDGTDDESSNIKMGGIQGSVSQLATCSQVMQCGRKALCPVFHTEVIRKSERFPRKAGAEQREI